MTESRSPEQRYPEHNRISYPCYAEILLTVDGLFSEFECCGTTTDDRRSFPVPGSKVPCQPESNSVFVTKTAQLVDSRNNNINDPLEYPENTERL